MQRAARTNRSARCAPSRSVDAGRGRGFVGSTLARASAGDIQRKKRTVSHTHITSPPIVSMFERATYRHGGFTAGEVCEPPLPIVHGTSHLLKGGAHVMVGAHTTHIVTPDLVSLPILMPQPRTNVVFRAAGVSDECRRVRVRLIGTTSQAPANQQTSRVWRRTVPPYSRLRTVRPPVGTLAGRCAR